MPPNGGNVIVLLTELNLGMRASRSMHVAIIQVLCNYKDLGICLIFGAVQDSIPTVLDEMLAVVRRIFTDVFKIVFGL